MRGGEALMDTEEMRNLFKHVKELANIGEKLPTQANLNRIKHIIERAEEVAALPAKKH